VEILELLHGRVETDTATRRCTENPQSAFFLVYVYDLLMFWLLGFRMQVFRMENLLGGCNHNAVQRGRGAVAVLLSSHAPAIFVFLWGS